MTTHARHLALGLIGALSLAACGGGGAKSPTAQATATTVTTIVAASTTTSPPGTTPTTAAATTTTAAAAKVPANSATAAQLVAAFEAAGISNASRWATEVQEYRPYPTNDPTFAKLRQNLAKYNPGPGVVDAIVATLSLS
jgi:hypothetical protein